MELIFKKIRRKIIFTLKIANLGDSLKSKIILLYNSILIQKNLYTNKKSRSFSVTLLNKNKKVLVDFSGTLDELHALDEIFVERCYKPEIKNVKNILDLGANIGLFSVWAYTEFNNPIIHAYEPNPEIYDILKKNLSRLNNTTTFNSAISSKNGWLTFYKSNRSFSSSMFKTETNESIEVPSINLDEVVEKIGGNVDFAKIDIEGAEFEAIEGSKKISSINFIAYEIHPEKAGKNSSELTRNLSTTHKIETFVENKKTVLHALRIS